MKRRDLFKMLGTLAAVPFVAPLVALCKPKELPVQDWSMNPIAVAAGHVKHPSLTANDDLSMPSDEGGSAAGMHILGVYAPKGLLCSACSST
jgi:hypothetical protein